MLIVQQVVEFMLGAFSVCFMLWFLARAFVIWTRRDGEGRNLAAALTVVVVLLLAHSLLDYPLRTQAIEALFAFACGTIAVYRPGRRADAAPAAP